jgi:hypothetical protein
MVLRTYRFRAREGVELLNISSKVGISVSLVGQSGGRVVDFQADDSNESDFLEVMAGEGFEFLSTNPATAREEQFSQGVDGDALHVDFSPTNYTPDDAPPEAPNVDALTAHLKGIDTALAGGVVDDKRVKVSVDDTTPGFLEEKVVQGDGVSISVLNPGANELLEVAASIETIFSVDQIVATNILTTTASTYQDGFAGQTPNYVEAAVAGDYLVFFSTDISNSNNNGQGEIGLAKNGLVPEAASLRLFGSIFQGHSVSIYRFVGLTAGDRIFGVYRHFAGPGSTTLYNRTLLMFRVK